MPARPPLLADPPPLVVQGDQLFSSVLPTLGLMPPLTQGDQPSLAFGAQPLVVEQRIVGGTMPAPTLQLRVSSRGPWSDQDTRRANAGIATPMGDWIPILRGGILLNPFTQSSTRFAFVGITRDNTGAPLGNCTVRAFDVGRRAADGMEAEVGETVSDGSGAYTLSVGYNTAHQLTAYLSGAPDRAGISVQSAVPDAIG